jgi:hypothetical protein
MKKNTKHKKISLRLKKENDNNYRPVSPIVERVFTDNEEKIEEYKNPKKQHIPSSNKSHHISSNNNSNDTNLNDIKAMQHKLKKLQHQSDYLQAVNSVYLDMLQGKNIEGFDNSIANYKHKQPSSQHNRQHQSYYLPSSNTSPYIYPYAAPYQPYMYINPQAPNILPRINNLIPVHNRPSKRRNLLRTRSDGDFMIDKYSDRYLEQTKQSLQLFDQGLREYFCK